MKENDDDKFVTLDPLMDRSFGQPLPTRTRSNERQHGSGSRSVLGLVAIVGVVIVGAVALGLNDDDSTPSADPAAPAVESKLVVVSDPANTALVRWVAGGLLRVQSIVPPGANGHTYEPVPADAVVAATADLYIDNGRGLNDSVTDFVRANYRSGTPEVVLSDVIPKDEVIATDSAEEIASHGHAHSFNAHFWTDPIYASRYVERIATALSSIDPANGATYAARAQEFVARMTTYDSAFRAAIASIPEENRKLVVYHDSWSYFGRRYGIPIVGAIQPVSFSEPSADEVRRMIDQIRSERVPAFFGSEVFPSDVLDAIAAETGSVYYSDLSDEELPGAPGTPEHSYEGMMLQNVRRITSALGGDTTILDSLLLPEVVS
jgi:ABC-type Zn uptake system ZnuABC Zn-binding protein ZnuA